MLETTSDSKSGPEFVEKFFTERELHVLDEKSGTGEVAVSYTHLTLPTSDLV